MLLSLWGLVVCFALYGQTVLEDIQRDIQNTASNYMKYPEPKQTVLTPAPKGMQPFYISHYGRHGSRFHSKPSMYNDPYLTLAKADSLGKLTLLGQDVLHRLDIIRHDAENRWGELTPLGAEQQRQIARRMVERFPEVFEGNTDVEARSTPVGRCILSMDYALMELLTQNPKLNIHHNATHRDISYLNLQDKKLTALKFNKPANALYQQYIDRQVASTRLMRSLFNDTTYISHDVDAKELEVQLLLLAAIMQNTELGKQVTLYDIFTTEEAYRIWERGNVYWYVGWGACTVNGGVQPYSQRNLLSKLIADADSCINSEKPHVQLRFGHETVLMPFICLIDINGYGLSTDNLDVLEENGWANYRIIPMSANVQFIFYRRHPKDKQVLFKVLLNENEATLPLPTDQPPYYKYSDFRDYCLRKLEAYDEKGGQP